MQTGKNGYQIAIIVAARNSLFSVHCSRTCRAYACFVFIIRGATTAYSSMANFRYGIYLQYSFGSLAVITLLTGMHVCVWCKYGIENGSFRSSLLIFRSHSFLSRQMAFQARPRKGLVHYMICKPPFFKAFFT